VSAGGRPPRFGPQSARRTVAVSAAAAVERWRAKSNHLFDGGGHPTGIQRRLLCISNCGGYAAAE